MKKVTLFLILAALAALAALPALANTNPPPACTPEKGNLFYPVTPCRALDTRTGSPVSHGTTYAFRVQGLCGVPVGAAAVSMQVTATNASSNGFLSVWPMGVAFPGVSTVGFLAANTVADVGAAAGTIVPLAHVSTTTDEDIQILYGVPQNVTTATVDVVLDVNGYFLPDCDVSGDED